MDNFCNGEMYVQLEKNNSNDYYGTTETTVIGEMRMYIWQINICSKTKDVMADDCHYLDAHNTTKQT